MRKFALLHVSGCRRISVQLLCNSVMHFADGHCFPREATLTGFETDCRISSCCAILTETCTNQGINRASRELALCGVAQINAVQVSDFVRKNLASSARHGRRQPWS